MKLGMGKSQPFRQVDHIYPAVPDTNHLWKKMTESIAIFVLTWVGMTIFLFPNLINLLTQAVMHINALTPLTTFSYVLFSALLIAIPGKNLAEAIHAYQNARQLDILGRMTRGIILDQLTKQHNGQTIYLVHYQYLSGLSAVQVVDQNIYEQLSRGTSVFVVYLETQRQLSRLDLD